MQFARDKYACRHISPEIKARPQNCRMQCIRAYMHSYADTYARSFSKVLDFPSALLEAGRHVHPAFQQQRDRRDSESRLNLANVLRESLSPPRAKPREKSALASCNQDSHAARTSEVHLTRISAACRADKADRYSRRTLHRELMHRAKTGNYADARYRPLRCVLCAYYAMPGATKNMR